MWSQRSIMKNHNVLTGRTVNGAKGRFFSSDGVGCVVPPPWYDVRIRRVTPPRRIQIHGIDGYQWRSHVSAVSEGLARLCDP
jgi:hypothetical protein